jgi:hypothetical protein
MPRFFHVDRTSALHEGQELELTAWEEVPPEQKIPDAALQSHVEQLFPNGLSWHGRGYLFWQNAFAFPPQPGLYDAANLDNMRSHGIDLLFEYVRRAFFPDRPSRYQSAFGWSSLEDANRFLSGGGASGAAIWEIEGEAPFQADMNLLVLGTALSSSLFAHRYWNGESQPDKPPHWEHFIAPGARVLGRIA